mgnify:CR=1 FL=1
MITRKQDCRHLQISKDRRPGVLIMLKQAATEAIPFSRISAAKRTRQQAADRIGQVLGSVVFRLPYSQELEEQYLAGELLADLSMKDSRAFRKEIDRICEEVF